MVSCVLLQKVVLCTHGALTMTVGLGMAHPGTISCPNQSKPYQESMLLIFHVAAGTQLCDVVMVSALSVYSSKYVHAKVECVRS